MFFLLGFFNFLINFISLIGLVVFFIWLILAVISGVIAFYVEGVPRTIALMVFGWFVITFFILATATEFLFNLFIGSLF